MLQNGVGCKTSNSSGPATATDGVMAALRLFRGGRGALSLVAPAAPPEPAAPTAAVGEAAPPEPAPGDFLAFQRCAFFGRQPVGSFLEVALHRRALIPLRRDSRQGRASQDDGAGGLKRARQQRPQGLTAVHGA